MVANPAERPVYVAMMVKPQLQWRLQDIGDARTVRYLQKRPAEVE